MTRPFNDFLASEPCDSPGAEHQWKEEVRVAEFRTWGHGAMRLRHCEKCENVEYLEFTADDGTKTDITAMTVQQTMAKYYGDVLPQLLAQLRTT